MGLEDQNGKERENFESPSVDSFASHFVAFSNGIFPPKGGIPFGQQFFFDFRQHAIPSG
jgi:hypothetical protein